MRIDKVSKDSFAVIEKEGSTRDRNGFIQRLWQDANSHFDEIADLAKRDGSGNPVGIWGAMTDFSRSFEPWDDFKRGLYLAGAECRDDAETPEGWVKWVIPAYDCLAVEREEDNTFSDMRQYMKKNGIPLAGAVHDYSCPETGKTENKNRRMIFAGGSVMNRHTFSLMLLLFSLLMLLVFSFGAQAENEPVESLLSAVIQESYPDCQLFDYAPIGPEKAEYIALTMDSEEKPAVMIVNTEQSAACVELRNDKILEGIPLDKGTVRVMDHMLNGYPYIEYRAADGLEFLYVVFHKNEGSRWIVNEVQFGDEWHDLYWFRYEDRDQKLHIYLTGNELMTISSDAVNLLAESFKPADARACLRAELTPFLLNQRTAEYDKTAEECFNAAWLMNGTAYDDLLENLTDRISSRQTYAVTGTVRYVIHGTVQRAVFDINDERVPFSLLISNLSDTEWTEGSTYMVYAEAYAYSETEKLPWLLAGYTYLK